MSALFSLEHVTLRRGGVVILDSVSAVLPRGASCVWGPSGCGKSSLLRLLNRLVDVDEGTVRYDGQDVRSIDPIPLRRAVALVPQLPALVAETVADNVAYAPRLRRTDVDVGLLLERVGLDPEIAGRTAERLSVGERQRVVLARALATEPRVLLLDEPTSALDAGARDVVEETLRRLQEELDLSFVLVTHDRRQAARMAEWGLHLVAGRVADSGPLMSLLRASS